MVIVVQNQGILEGFFEGLRREYTGRKGVFDRRRRRQASRENLGCLLGVGVLCLDLFLSTKNRRSMFKIAVDQFPEGGHFCTTYWQGDS